MRHPLPPTSASGVHCWMRSKENAPAPAELVAAAGGEGIENTEQYRRALEIKHDFEEWSDLNRDRRDEVERWAVNEAAHQRKISIQSALEHIRAKDFVNAEGKPCKVSNSYGALWIRILVAQHPEIKPFVVMRPSIFDHVEVTE